MQIVALVTIMKKQLYCDQLQTSISLQEILNKTDEETPLYLQDHDALQGQGPSFDVFQRLCVHRPLWIDAGPQSVGDVIDLFMAGATVVIIRPHHWKRCSMQDIKQYTENPVYYEISTHDPGISLTESDGYVFLDDSQLSTASQLPSNIMRLGSTKPVYVYTTAAYLPSEWKEKAQVGRIIDLKDYRKGVMS
jgi:hypothetical protein